MEPAARLLSEPGGGRYVGRVRQNVSQSSRASKGQMLRQTNSGRKASAAAVAAVLRGAGKSREVWLGTILFVAVVLAYIPAIQAGWVWDDDDYVTHNPTLRSLVGLWRIWFEPGAVPQYYPLVHTVFWFEYQLWGLWPAGFHLTNVALHSACAVLLWGVLRRLSLPGAYLAAALWALHPVQVESVAWVTERKNTLSGVFYLAATWMAIGGRSRGEGLGQGRRYVASLALYFAALLSKTVTATWPVVVALLLWAKRGKIAVRDLVPWVPAVAIGGLMAGITVTMEQWRVGAMGADWDLTFLQRLLIATRALWFYLGKLTWPAELVFVYPRWTISVSDPWAYVPLGGCVVMFVVLIVLARWNRWPLVAGVYFTVTLGPALGFVNVFPMRYSFVADHFQYLASIGPISLVVCGLSALWQSAVASRVGLHRQTEVGIFLQGMFACLAIVLAFLTWRQSHAYRDAETLWRDTLRKNPQAWMAHNNLGLLLLEQGKLSEAKSHFEQALAAKPDDSFAMNNLGLVHARREQWQEAAHWFVRALEADPGQAEAANNLGNVFARTEQWEEAEQAFRLALQRKASYAEAWNNLANVFALRGQTEQAIHAYQQALASDPAYLDAMLNLARILYASGHSDEAITWLEEVLRRDPRNHAARELRAEIRGTREP